MRKTALAQQLAVVAGFESPQVGLEQYPTPPELAAHLIHVADLLGDVEDRIVIDLGTGTGMLALGAALRGPAAVLGIDLDGGALGIARENRRRVGTATPIAWVRGDVSRPPLRVRAHRSTEKGRKRNDAEHGAETGATERPVTVVMNPPFGAQNSNEHADRAFLETTSQVADVSYSVHNRGSREFVEAFVADEGGEVTQGFRAEIDLPRQFDFHGEERRELDVEVFRVAWSE
jgi:putative methylase